MSENTTSGETPGSIPPVSSFTGPVGELVAHGLLSPPPRPGVLAALDRFEILRLLGGGGMGVVLLARDTSSGKDVAVKLVRPDLVSDQQVVHRFVKEAGHMQRLRHRNVMPVLEVSDRSRGPYFVMPYYERGSLSRRIRPGQPLDGDAILDTASQIAEGLQYAHRRGIIHRDLKPANILLAADGKACLADFGLARTMFNDTIVDVERQQFEGTAPYMSPGVAAGNAEDTRCDIYAFGALLYEMLTGEPPYKGATVKEIRTQILTGPPKPISELNPKADPNLVIIAEGAMARELRDRYADMIDVLTDLQRARAGATPVGPHGSAERPRGAAPRGAPTPWHYWAPAGILGIAVAVWLIFWPPTTAPVASKPPTPGPIIRTNEPAVIPTNAPPVARTNEPSVIRTNAAPVTNHISPPETWTLTSLAGQPGVPGSVDGAGSAAKFSGPCGLVVRDRGIIYVADTGNDTIRKLTPDGSVTTLAGLAGNHGVLDNLGVNARFWAPSGLAGDAAGNLYVADAKNHAIRKLSPDGAVVIFAGMGGVFGTRDGSGISARFNGPQGVAVDAAGNIFVADSGNCTIRKIDPDGRVITLAGTAGSSGGSDGIGRDARFNHPAGLAVDGAGNIYVADTGNHTIRKVTSAGVVTTMAGSAGSSGDADGVSTSARFFRPGAVAVDRANNVYVADTGNDLIRKISADRVVTTVGRPPGVNDNGGIPGGPQFNHPAGVAVDASGTLYVADTGDDVVVKLVRSPGKSN